MTHSSIFGPASARIHLQPLYQAAENLGLHPRILSLDINQPGILNQLGNPRLCVIGKINHYDDRRIEGFAMAVLAAISRLKASGAQIVVSYCDNLAPLSCARVLFTGSSFLADYLVVPCQAMASLARRWTCPDCPYTLLMILGRSDLPYPPLEKTTHLISFGLEIPIIYIIYAMRFLLLLLLPSQRLDTGLIFYLT